MSVDAKVHHEPGRSPTGSRSGWAGDAGHGGGVRTGWKATRRVRGTSVYCVPRFAQGAGLGNRLFPWARCAVFSALTGAVPLRPRWFQPRVGPLLRGGIDVSQYARSFLMLGIFRHVAGEIGGVRARWIESTAARVPEPRALDSAAAATLPPGSLVTFSGYGDHFGQLEGWQDFLRGRLEAMTGERWLRVVRELGEIPIAIHVRRGPDFPDPTPEDLERPHGPVRTPLTWFRQTLQVIRDHVGYSARAVVVSDGIERELRELLALDNTVLVRPRCVVSDLLTLSRARVLLASGGSSFSAWGAFLGRMPTVSLTGQSLAWFRLRACGGAYVGEFDPGRPNVPVLREIRYALTGQGIE
jgi:hypothetical protein